MPPARGSVGKGVPPPDVLLRALLDAQNQDGGWGYGIGVSWTEPTVFCLLALHAWNAAAPSCERAGSWVVKCLREDGGVAPNLEVSQSTWVTALALLGFRLTGIGPSEASLQQWLLQTRSEDSRWFHRLQQFVRGIDSEDNSPAWPWLPGAAAWVFPTACTLAALKSADPRRLPPQVDQRIRQAEKFLALRVCRDGGWNHGSSSALGYDSDSYPETTGAALVGLRGSGMNEVIRRGVERAQAHLAVCDSFYAGAWLELGLLAHGANPVPRSISPAMNQPMEVALALIVLAAREGRPVLWRNP